MFFGDISIQIFAYLKKMSSLSSYHWNGRVLLYHLQDDLSLFQTPDVVKNALC